MKKSTLIILILLLISLGSCVTEQKCKAKFPVVESRDSIVVQYDSIVYRDTVIYTHLETAQTTVQLAAGSNGNINIVAVDSEQGNHVRSNVSIHDNIVIAECIVDSLAVYVLLKERYKSVETLKSKVITRIKTTNVLSGWQYAQLYAGRLLLLLITLLIGYSIYKLWKQKTI